MPERISIITSRRGYEYDLDQLRLSTVVTQPVADVIQRVFQFQAKQIGSPLPTFGAVPPTMPPGIVFNFGSLTLDDGTIVAIRFLHFEAQRIVIDIAGPSSVIDAVFQQLEALLKEVPTADGRSVISAPRHVKDYSEINAVLTFMPKSLLPAPLRTAVLNALTKKGRETEASVITPVVEVRIQRKDEQYAGALPEEPVMRLELRAGSLPGERVYFSIAPLTSDEHIALLEELEKGLS